ncbi:MAG: hypothetical protein JXA14_24015 [Anaerolineae bacterium]|nr:hypothetical protein [Anaerolineae bacterium]
MVDESRRSLLLSVSLGLLVLALLWVVSLTARPAAAQRQETVSAALADTTAPAELSGFSWKPDFYWPVQFVGQDHVDLKWALYSDWPTYKVMRNGTQIAQFDTATTFHRDTGLSQGQVVTYQMCAAKPGYADYCGNVQQVTVGEIDGKIWEDLSWDADHYELNCRVGITAGAALHIGPGARVTRDPACATTDISDGLSPQGSVQAEGARFERVELRLLNPGSSFRNSTLVLCYGNGMLLRWGNASQVTGSTFQTSTLTLFYDDRSTVLAFTGNSFYNSKLRVGDYAPHLANLHLYGNRFYDGSQVMMMGESEGEIEDNQFWDSLVSVSTPNPVAVRYNLFRRGGITVYGWSPATAEQNLLDGMQAGHGLDGPVGIFVRGVLPGSGLAAEQVVIRDNAIIGCAKGIELLGDLDVEVIGNTIAANSLGIQVDSVDGSYILDPAAAIHDNCIAGNGCPYGDCGGLTTYARTDPLDATGNYWGHPSGPTHDANPDGHGDKIIEFGGAGNVVDYSGWLPDYECTTNDLSIAGLEVVQVVQDLNNSVPLVTGKPAVVRVYADSLMDTVSAAVRVEAYRDGTLLGTLAGIATASPVIDWDTVRSQPGLTLHLPEQWLSGTLTLQATIDPDDNITEASENNNTYAQQASFAPRAPLRVAYLPIWYEPAPGLRLQPNMAGLPTMHTFMQQVYPLSQVTYTIWTSFTWPFQMDGHPREAERANTVLARLTLEFQIHNAFHPEAPVDQVFGVFPVGAVSFCISNPPWLGSAGVASYCASGGSYMAHEIGHNLGLRHPNTPDACDALDPGTDWPYTDATIQEYGYDVANNQILVPWDYTDIMAYCEPNEWISPFHARKLFDVLKAPPTSTLATDTAQTYLLVSGQVHADGSVAFLPSWQITPTRPPALPPAGTGYCLELRDGGGLVLESYCFDLAFYNHETYQPTDVDTFVVALPLHAAAAGVVLRQGTTDLGQVMASSHPPTVELLAPDGGESLGKRVEVRWNASDDDHDELAYNLLYSSDDGATWQPVAINITGTTTYAQSLELLPGTTAGRMRVEASDGFHTTGDESDGTFDVPDKAPWVAITLPEAGSLVAPPLMLHGIAYDLEEGELQGAALAWVSSLDGQLGTGSTLPGVALSPGEHRLTLTATDSQGLNASDTVTVTVKAVLHDIYLPLVLRNS